MRPDFGFLSICILDRPVWFDEMNRNVQFFHVLQMCIRISSTLWSNAHIHSTTLFQLAFAPMGTNSRVRWTRELVIFLFLLSSSPSPPLTPYHSTTSHFTHSRFGVWGRVDRQLFPFLIKVSFIYAHNERKKKRKLFHTPKASQLFWKRKTKSECNIVCIVSLINIFTVNGIAMSFLCNLVQQWDRNPKNDMRINHQKVGLASNRIRANLLQ